MQDVRSREIVVARYKEDISWLLQVSPLWLITVYNKGPSNIPEAVTSAGNITIIELENKGREAETYAQHMLKRYHTIADLTIYIQGDPFDHSPELLEAIKVLEKRTKLSYEERYIPLTIQYNSVIPPPHIVSGRKHRYYRVGSISAYTLDCIDFIDGPIQNVTNDWLNRNNYKIGTNILFNSLHQISPNILFTERETILMNFAACFALTRSGHMTYPQSFYEGLHKYSFKDVSTPYILERLWLHIFNNTFDIRKVLPEILIKPELPVVASLENKKEDNNPVRTTGNRSNMLRMRYLSNRINKERTTAPVVTQPQPRPQPQPEIIANITSKHTNSTNISPVTRPTKLFYRFKHFKVR
jgi:hypothetical protein